MTSLFSNATLAFLLNATLGNSVPIMSWKPAPAAMTRVRRAKDNQALLLLRVANRKYKLTKIYVCTVLRTKTGQNYGRTIVFFNEEQSSETISSTHTSR